MGNPACLPRPTCSACDLRECDPDARRPRVVPPGVLEAEADRVLRIVAHEDALGQRKECDLDAGTSQLSEDRASCVAISRRVEPGDEVEVHRRKASAGGDWRVSSGRPPCGGPRDVRPLYGPGPPSPQGRAGGPRPVSPSGPHRSPPGEPGRHPARTEPRPSGSEPIDAIPEWGTIVRTAAAPIERASEPIPSDIGFLGGA